MPKLGIFPEQNSSIFSAPTGSNLFANAAVILSCNGTQATPPSPFPFPTTTRSGSARFSPSSAKASCPRICFSDESPVARRAPRGQCKPLAAIDHRVTQVLAHKRGVVQIMMLGDESVATCHILRISKHNDLQVIQDMLLGGLKWCSFRFTHPQRVKDLGEVVPTNRLSPSASTHYSL